MLPITIRHTDHCGNISYIKRHDDGRVRSVTAAGTPTSLSNYFHRDAEMVSMRLARCTTDRAMLDVVRRVPGRVGQFDLMPEDLRSPKDPLLDAVAQYRLAEDLELSPVDQLRLIADRMEEDLQAKVSIRRRRMIEV